MTAVAVWTVGVTDGHIRRRVLKIKLPGKSKRGRPKRRFMDVVRDDMQVDGVTKQYAIKRWIQISH